MEGVLDILFVDDQWCQPEMQSIIIAEYGALQRRQVPYAFHFGTAQDGKGGYAVEPVLEQIRSLPRLRALILDIMFGEQDQLLGLEILGAVRTEYPTLPIFMMTSLEGDVEVLEHAMACGANEYLVKKPTLRELETVLQIYTQPSAKEADYAIWGNAPAIKQLRADIARVAFSGSLSVLVLGESGTGKELVARAIHRQGPRRNGSFVDKNCAYDRSELLDDDLFGHEKGAFTNATNQHIGRIERAHGGVLFLDEIGSMSLALQGKLLRVLETRQFERLGGSVKQNSDFQLLCATNDDPAQMVSSGELRQDLYYRIDQFRIHVPPLRDRAEDIPILANLFLQRFRAGPGASYRADRFSDEAMQSLQTYSWPGNVRELKNVVERAVILSRTAEIQTMALTSEVVGNSLQNLSNPMQEALEGVPIDVADDPCEWHRQRLKMELSLALKAKEYVRLYKGENLWKAEFMRIMYPACRAQSAKGFNDLIRRLTKGPWGDPDYEQDSELTSLLRELKA